MSKRIMFVGGMLAVAAFLIVSCGGQKNGEEGSSSNSAETGSAKPLYKSAGDEGTITGKIAFTGEAPKPKTIDMDKDAACVSAPGEKTTEEVVVNNGTLGDVFVYVKGGAVDKYSFDVPTAKVDLDQKGCRYHPHVLGVMANQTLNIVNSDPTTHNIHPSPKSNTEWNQSQPPGAAPLEKKFGRPEVLIPVKCNQHPWMRCYIGVMSSPFYAVSSTTDGTYTIANLPPGDYTLVAWQEKYGEQTAKVTVTAKGSVTHDFTFTPSAAYAPTSLKVQPALVLP
ncbi:MAG TPA: carboxypeptidase regulatory-like domain-containing protein [Blastocatellia bacterium]|nr:carboxypeptidase regulatory-like domain-containing protein [Blastocatellia bacterium]